MLGMAAGLATGGIIGGRIIGTGGRIKGGMMPIAPGGRGGNIGLIIGVYGDA